MITDTEKTPGTDPKHSMPVVGTEPAGGKMHDGAGNSPVAPASAESKRSSRIETIKTLIIMLIAAAVLGVVFAMSLGWEIPGLTKKVEAKRNEKPAPLKVSIVKDERDPKALTHTLLVPEDVRNALRIRQNGVDVVATATLPTSNQSLELPGSTALNPAKIARIRVRFPTNGTEVVSIAKTTDNLGNTQRRELRPGDTVKAGQELATFYSVDVGSRKNDLIDAICQLKLDQQILERAQKAPGAVPEVFVLNAMRAVAGDVNTINRAVKNLETWNVPKEDIQAVRDEAEELSKLQQLGQGMREPSNPERERLWGQVTLKSPIDGVIIERNVTEKEIIVDNTINVFQIANVDDLLVLVNAPEDQLPRLRDIKDKGLLRWTIQTAGAPAKFKLTLKALDSLGGDTFPASVMDKIKSLRDREFNSRQSFEEELAKSLSQEERERWQKKIVDAARTGLVGAVDEIGYMIDQNMHTAILKGFIKNEGGALRAGQYVTATIELPREKDVVEVPMAAIADDGRQTVVFIQPDPKKAEYTMRRVKVTHRFDKVAYVKCVLSEDEIALGRAQSKEQGLLPFSPLKEGDRVLTSGLLELKKELDDREATIAAGDKP